MNRPARSSPEQIAACRLAGRWLRFRAMSTVEQIEQAITELPAEDLAKLAAWMERQRQVRATAHPEAEDTTAVASLRDHSAFLNSYGSEDEGLYDCATGR